VVVPTETATHAELEDALRAHSPFPVSTLVSGTPLQRNHVHLCPPEVDVLLSQGTFLTQPTSLSEGISTPIDLLLATVAATSDEYACVCFLSGEDTHDGMRGLIDITRRGGVCYVIEPDATPLSALPRALMASGWADGTFDKNSFTTHVGAHRDRLLGQDRIWHSFSHRLPTWAFDKTATRIVGAVSSESGLDFRRFRQTPLHRHMEARALALGVSTFSDYGDFVEQNASEALVLARLFLDNRTSFFRDAQTFDDLRSQVVAPLLEERAREAEAHGHKPHPLRVWVAACSTGEEAYSIALLCTRLMEARGIRVPIEIVATDASPAALAKAERGEFDVVTLAGLSPLDLTDFFVLVSQNLFRARALPGISLTFLEHHVLSPPLCTDFDLVCARNVLSFFEDDAQVQILAHLHDALKTGGTLFVARMESSSSHLTHGFRRMERGSTLFEKVPHVWNRRSSERAERSRNLQRTFSDAPSLVVAEDLLVVECDDEAFSYFRTSPDSTHCDFLPLVHASHRPAWADALRRALAGMVEVTIEADFRHGEGFPYRGRITPFLDEQGGRRLKIEYEKT
jgi:two-component system CheB/CheR fusion protein